MKELDKSKSYYLGDLNEEQKDTLCKEAGTQEHNRSNLDTCKYMCYNDEYKTWLYSDKPDFESVNALELFYTLENIQVYCFDLEKNRIKDIVDVFNKKGYKLMYNIVCDTKNIRDKSIYISLNLIKKVGLHEAKENKQKISYNKFMELFGSKKEYKTTEQKTLDAFEKACKELNKLGVNASDISNALNIDTKQTKVSDVIDKPQHYAKGIDTFKRMEENCTLDERLAFAKGNIDKYTWREKGQDKEDFEKIISYAQWAIKQLTND